MKHARFELTSEQTIRLQDLRNALVEILPANITQKIEFPVTHFDGCGAVCMPGCTGSCTSYCGNNCANCSGTCMGECGGCLGGCLGCKLFF